MAWPVVGRLAQTLPNNNNKKFEAKRTSSFRFEQRTSFYFDENGEKKNKNWFLQKLDKLEKNKILNAKVQFWKEMKKFFNI